MDAAATRLLDSRIESQLRERVAVILTGPSYSGKHLCALSHAASAAILDAQIPQPTAAPINTDSIQQGPEFVKNVQLDPSLALKGKDPHAIIGQHLVPVLASQVNAYVQALYEAGIRGALILTSEEDSYHRFQSATSSTQTNKDALACLRMLPLSLQEQGLSTGAVSLAGLFEGTIRQTSDCISAHNSTQQLIAQSLTSSDVAHMVSRGGWLTSQDELTQEDIDIMVRQILDEAADRAHITSEGATACAWALARLLSDIPKVEQIASGMEAMTGARPARDTIRRYLSDLTAQQLLLPITGWTAPGRTRARSHAKPKYYFVDPSIPASLLVGQEQRIAEHPQLLTALLKNLVLRDLHIYMEANAIDDESWHIYHYLDNRGTAVDFVLEQEKQSTYRWGGVQVVLSEASIPEAYRNLQALARKSAVPPTFLIVICAQSYALKELGQSDSCIWQVPLTHFSA